MPDHSVLIVEDDTEVREELAGFFERKGWGVVVASNGRDAVELFRQKPTEVVVTDLVMPHKGGLEVLREVKRLDPGVPVIVMTGYGSLENCRQALCDGAEDFFQKPESEAVLLSAVERAVGKREKARLSVVGDPDIGAPTNVRTTTPSASNAKRN